MTKNKSFYLSLKHAVCGFFDALKIERNLRFHVVVGNLICFFAAHFGINRTQWAVLLLAICAVIASELMNSAVEKAVDTATHEIRTEARLAKDFAAAATLISAIFSLLVGIALFADINKIIAALTAIFTQPVSLVILGVLSIIDLIILFARRKHE